MNSPILFCERANAIFAKVQVRAKLALGVAQKTLTLFCAIKSAILCVYVTIVQIGTRVLLLSALRLRIADLRREQAPTLQCVLGLRWAFRCACGAIAQTSLVQASAPNPDEGGTNEVCALALDLAKGLTPPLGTGDYCPTLCVLF